MSGLRILFTNNTLDARAGSELYVRDLATALVALGHSPVAYSTRLGEVAEELRAATVPVVDDLGRIATPLDLIHGQHHLETMTALLHFPGVPAVYFCHGWIPWEEAPPRFPRILRYVAVDDTCRDRLVLESGIPAERVRVVLNFVDPERFRPREPLPARPRRALVFSNSARPGSYLEAVREGCQRAGLALDVIGAGMGTATSRPEDVVGSYDLVFAKGRSALEALTVGTAVVLCDAAGLGPMVTSAELDRLRRLNFGIRALREPVSPDLVAREIARYDPADAREVSTRIRASARQGPAVEQIVAIYREVLAEHAGKPPVPPLDEARAAAEYLRSLAGLVKQRYQLGAELHAARQALDAAAQRAAQEQKRLDGLLHEREQLAAEIRMMRTSVTFRARDRLSQLPVVGKLCRRLARMLSKRT